MDIKKAIGRALVPTFLLTSITGSFASSLEDEFNALLNAPTEQKKIINSTPKMGSEEIYSYVKSRNMLPISTGKALGNKRSFIFANKETGNWAHVLETKNGYEVKNSGTSGFNNMTYKYNTIKASYSDQFKDFYAACSNIPKDDRISYQVVFEAVTDRGEIFMEVAKKAPGAFNYWRQYTRKIDQDNCHVTTGSDYQVAYPLQLIQSQAPRIARIH